MFVNLQPNFPESINCLKSICFMKHSFKPQIYIENVFNSHFRGFTGLFFLLFFSLHLNAVTPVQQFVNDKLMSSANISILVKDLSTGNTICDYRSKNASVTASTMKVITTATALELFGEEYKFETRLETDGTLSKDSVLKGNLHIRASGDPTLGSEKIGDKDFLNQWVTVIRLAGINTIQGQIIVLDNIFDNEVINRKWTWEDMGNYYAPGIHGISYLDNTFRLYFKSGQAGTSTSIIKTDPVIDGLIIDNQVKSAAISSDNAYFFGAPFSNYRLVTGEIPAYRNDFVVKGDIPNPADILIQQLKERLQANGIKVFNKFFDKTSNNHRVIHTHFSPSLIEIIDETNINSNNHFAEYLFKLIGTKPTLPATNKQAIENIRMFWKSKGLSVEQLFQADGSGLSPTNAVSAEFFVKLLTYMKTQSKYSNAFYNSLPISGESGTLKNFLAKTSLQSKVHAKSGTISGVKSYVGYIDNKDKSMVFAVLVNNSNGSSKEVTQKIENFLVQISKE